MRTITINLYTFDELSDEAKEVAIKDAIEFEIEFMNENSPYCKYAEEMKQMKTPWFLAETLYNNEKESISESLRINDYTFENTGVMHNILKLDML